MNKSLMDIIKESLKGGVPTRKVVDRLLEQSVTEAEADATPDNEITNDGALIDWFGDNLFVLEFNAPEVAANFITAGVPEFGNAGFTVEQDGNYVIGGVVDTGAPVDVDEDKLATLLQTVINKSGLKITTFETE